MKRTEVIEFGTQVNIAHRHISSSESSADAYLVGSFTCARMLRETAVVSLH